MGKPLKLSKFDDLICIFFQFLLGNAVYGARKVNVFDGTKFWVETCPQLEEATEAPTDLAVAFAGAKNASQHLKKCGLS